MMACFGQASPLTRSSSPNTTYCACGNVRRCSRIFFGCSMILPGHKVYWQFHKAEYNGNMGGYKRLLHSDVELNEFVIIKFIRHG